MITTVIHFRYSGLQFRKKEEKGKKRSVFLQVANLGKSNLSRVWRASWQGNPAKEKTNCNNSPFLSILT